MRISCDILFRIVRICFESQDFGFVTERGSRVIFERKKIKKKNAYKFVCTINVFQESEDRNDSDHCW